MLGGTAGSESGTLTDQQSVIQTVASMNLSPNTNEFISEGCDDLNRKLSS